MTAETPTRKPPRPKLDEISWHRDLYLEVCEEQGFVPAGLPKGIQPLRNLIWVPLDSASFFSRGWTR